MARHCTKAAQGSMKSSGGCLNMSIIYRRGQLNYDIFSLPRRLFLDHYIIILSVAYAIT